MKKWLIVSIVVLVLALCGCGETDDATRSVDEFISGNLTPIANAGADQNISTGSSVTLSGGGSDADGDLLTYSWAFTSKPSDSTATLSNQTVANPSFTANLDGSYVLSLTVNDGTVNQIDSVTIIATSDNSAPTANAGPDQNVATGNLVTVNGGGSDVDGDLLTYNWAFTSKPAGSTATLSNLTVANPSFTANLDGTYVLSLTVNDGTVNSQVDPVTITAATLNSAPTANAGPDQNVATGNLVTLNGGGSDADGDLLTYNWAFTSKPAGSTATLSNLTVANPSFTANLDGTYVLGLTVNDGTVNSQVDSVTITAATLNSAPTANAGPDQNVATGNLVNLNGGGSDADGDLLTYSWAFTSKPAGSTATLSNLTVANPSFTANLDGTYVLSLTVNDGTVNSQVDSVTVTAAPPRLELYVQSRSLFNPTYNKATLPYSSVGDVNVSILGNSADYRIDTYKLVAIGGEFTITNVSAIDNNLNVIPYFQGLDNSLTVIEGNDVVFSLVAPLTGGATAQLSYNFQVVETGQTFSSLITFKSN